jgi:hypothetical protein
MHIYNRIAGSRQMRMFNIQIWWSISFCLDATVDVISDTECIAIGCYSASDIAIVVVVYTLIECELAILVIAVIILLCWKRFIVLKILLPVTLLLDKMERGPSRGG